MTHFYLHIYDAYGEAEDEEGVGCSLAEAHERAISGIRSLLSAEVLEGTIDLNGRIEIADRNQKVRLIVPFSEALRRVGAALPLGAAGTHFRPAFMH